MSDQRARRTSYGRARLPVAQRYVELASRNRPLVLGGIAALAVALVLGGAVWLTSGLVISNGPLSASHASFEATCSSCHTPGGEVGNDKCSVCHEKFSDHLGLYSFNAHYVYVSGDRTRAAVRDGEVPCVACHVEHQGRDADLVTPPESRCLTCHVDHDFVASHPPFEHEADVRTDADSLAFTHVAHVERVLDRDAHDDLERACLACHVPQADGRSFGSIDFDAHCATCHLGPDVESPVLPVLPAGAPIVTRTGDGVEVRLGVETLEAVRTREGPGEGWARSLSPAQFDAIDGEVSKLGIEHEDPWISHNLRVLRRAVYPGAELSDLLRSSPDPSPAPRSALHAEALETLRAYAAGLRGRPEPWVQAELEAIDETLALVARRLDDRNAVLNAARFRTARPDPTLTPEQVDELSAFAARVAEPCVTCHRIEQGAIARVRADQRTMRRARFDHGAHVLQRGCLDCHSQIPLLEYLDAPGDTPTTIDEAAIHNLPGIEQCRTCHTEALAPDRCLTCHVFHPGDESWARLLVDTN